MTNSLSVTTMLGILLVLSDITDAMGQGKPTLHVLVLAVTSLVNLLCEGLHTRVKRQQVIRDILAANLTKSAEDGSDKANMEDVHIVRLVTYFPSLHLYAFVIRTYVRDSVRNELRTRLVRQCRSRTKTAATCGQFRASFSKMECKSPSIKQSRRILERDVSKICEG